MCINHGPTSPYYDLPCHADFENGGVVQEKDVDDTQGEGFVGMGLGILSLD
jgi:hypothetical protein